MAGVLTALVIGAVIGWMWQRLTAKPLFRDVAASVTGWFAGSFTAVIFTFDGIAQSGSGGLGAVSFGLSDTLITGVPVVLVLVIAGHLVRRRRPAGDGVLGRYSAVLLGTLASGAAAFWILRDAVTAISPSHTY
jgi:hypothetical protein